MASDDDVNDVDVYSRKSHLPLSQWPLSIFHGELTSLYSSASSPASYSQNNFDLLEHDLHIFNHLPLSLICVHHGTSLEILIWTTFQSSNNNNGGKDENCAISIKWDNMITNLSFSNLLKILQMLLNSPENKFMKNLFFKFVSTSVQQGSRGSRIYWCKFSHLLCETSFDELLSGRRYNDLSCRVIDKDNIDWSSLLLWLMGLINRLLAMNRLNKVPVDQRVEHNKRSNRKYYVADRSQPQHVDVQIPGFLQEHCKKLRILSLI